MGVELRLAATMEPISLPPLNLPSQWSRFSFLRQRVTIPRLALAGLILCVMLSLAAISIVHAQSKPLWFQFGYTLNQTGQSFTYTVAKEGDDNILSSIQFLNGSPVTATLRVKVESISKDDVILRCRAISAGVEAALPESRLVKPDRELSLKDVASIHYKPGISLAIPIERGGTVFLNGNVMDYQPKIAFGVPLEPAADKMFIRCPVLTASDQLLSVLNGASAMTSSEAQAINLQTDSAGVFKFALQPFLGAVQGQSNWGEITFKLDGKDYLLVAAAPITGGDQPRPVWVRHDSQPDRATSCSRACIGTIPIPQ
jgi:hypothetical protein